jgi:hypothetical protein
MSNSLSRRSFAESEVPAYLHCLLCGVSAHRVHGFGRFNLQNFISFPNAWRVECPHTSMSLGGPHDALPYQASGHPRPRPARGTAHGRGAACEQASARPTRTVVGERRPPDGDRPPGGINAPPASRFCAVAVDEGVENLHRAPVGEEPSAGCGHEGLGDRRPYEAHPAP